MTGVYDVLRQIGPVALVVVWLGGQIVLYFWYRAKERAYLQHFPPVGGVPLEMVLPGSYWSSGKRAIREALWLQQADPELERMRCAARRRALYVFTWLFYGIFIISMVLPRWFFMVSAR